MATIVKGLVENSGVEKAFISAISARILGLDNSFSCDTDVDTQFASSGNTPTFGFSSSDFPGLVIRLTRANKLSYNTNYYNCYIIVSGETKASASISYIESNTYYGNDAMRKFYMASVVDADAGYIFLWLGSYNKTSISDTSAVVAFITDSDSYKYCGGYGSPNFELAPLYKGGDASVAYTATSLFNYAAAPGYLEYVTHVSFVNAGQEQFRLEDFVNCSTVTIGSSVAIQSDNYFAIGPHTLIAID